MKKIKYFGGEGEGEGKGWSVGEFPLKLIDDYFLSEKPKIIQNEKRN